MILKVVDQKLVQIVHKNFLNLYTVGNSQHKCLFWNVNDSLNLLIHSLLEVLTQILWMKWAVNTQQEWRSFMSSSSSSSSWKTRKEETSTKRKQREFSINSSSWETSFIIVLQVVMATRWKRQSLISLQLRFHFETSMCK